MLASDAVGAVAAIALAVPPIKDQFYRFRREREKRAGTRSLWPALRHLMVNAWEARRVEYDGFDSMLLLGGAIGLFVSFALKAFEA